MALAARKTSPADLALAAEQRLVDQFDTLQEISKTERKDIYGENHYKEVRELYTLYDRNTVDAPVFRPTVRVPENQVLGWHEAIELTDITPRIYLVKNLQQLKRDEINEAALQAQWRDSHVNLSLLYTMLWCWFCGTSFMQVGWDPTRRRGQGDVVAPWRDPESVFPDPYSLSEEDWAYVMTEDYMWIDKVRESWPEQAYRISDKRAAGVPQMSPSQRAGMKFGLEVPTGPMRMMVPGLAESNAPGDKRVKVRTLFTRDATRVKLKGDDTLQLDGVVKPEYRLRYPRGRMIIECEGVILYDDQNPYIHGEFPLVRFIGMPALHGIWAPPPFRYTKTLQEIEERMLTQVFENLVRLSNGVWFIDESTGIDAERFGGIPGEVQMKNQGTPTPDFVTPQAVQPVVMQIIEYLSAKQKDLQGFSDARRGKQPAGNTSGNMFDSAIQQSHVLTRGRSRLMYPSVCRLAWLMFATMAQYYKNGRNFIDPRAEGIGTVRFEPVSNSELDIYEAFLDPNSIEPMSAAILRSMVPMMRQMQLIDAASALDALRWPNSNVVLKRLEAEQAAAAQRDEERKAKKTRGKNERPR